MSSRYSKIMLGLSIGHLIILLIVILLFGRNRLPELGSAFGKGLNAFKKGLEGKDSNDPQHKNDDNHRLS